MTIDPLKAEIKLINEGIKFECKAGAGNPEIITDYYPPLGNNEGYKPLELFLISFGTCISGTIIPILRNMKKNITAYELQISGVRREEHPTTFTSIDIEISIESENLEQKELDTAIKMSEQKYCPVSAMLRDDIKINTRYNIVKK